MTNANGFHGRSLGHHIERHLCFSFWFSMRHRSQLNSDHLVGACLPDWRMPGGCRSCGAFAPNVEIPGHPMNQPEVYEVFMNPWLLWGFMPGFIHFSL